MKRTLLTVISVCLVLAAIFGIYAGAVGLDDISAIVRYTNNQRQVVAQIADETEKGVTELEAEEEQRKQDLLEAAEGSVVEQIGGSKLANGELQYEAGKDKLNAGQKEYDEGKAQYDAAKALYDEKLAEYNNACERLEEGKAQLADAKAQRDAGQKKLDEATPAYNELKIYVDLANGKVYEHTRFLADPIARLYGYDSVEAVLEAYEAGQQQLADANVQIADAEKQIADGEKQLADAKVQLDEGKKQLDAAKAQLDEGKKQLDEGKSRLDSAKAELDAGRRAVSESVENLQDALDALKAYDDAESKVKAGVAELMKIPGIAEQVEDESDYRSVLEAARSFIESNKDGVNAEMTVRQRLYVMLIVACAVCAAAGVAGIIASLTPTGVRLATCAIASVAAAALSVGFMIYGLVNGSHSFAYFYMDKLGNVAGDGRLQSTALLIAAVAALCTAALALLCRSVYNKVLLGVSPEEGEDDIEEAPVEVEEPAPEK
ncbi:MAG: hypothetical protein KIG31_01100 [Oscillospiraceae bacterium]|nr:hypothetical protein [Oscillospiraceae bacterium]